MKYQIEADIIAFLKDTIASLCPFASAQQVFLSFDTDNETLKLHYHPEEIAVTLIRLLCRIITFTPQQSSVRVQANFMTTPFFQIKFLIQISSVDLSRIGEITRDCPFNVTVTYQENMGTTFELYWHLMQPSTYPKESNYIRKQLPLEVRGFYAEIRKRLYSHFSSMENRVHLMAAKNPQDGIFIQKVNAIILANLNNENFDTAYLSKSLAMSRTKLFRRLKALIQESPAHYVRRFRLQKAKEMLETSDFSVGKLLLEQAFKVKATLHEYSSNVMVFDLLLFGATTNKATIRLKLALIKLTISL